MRTGPANALGLLLALAVAIGAALAVGRPAPETPGNAATTGPQRIISLTAVSDRILLDLIEPERLIACSTWSRGSWTFRLGDHLRLRGAEDLEQVLALGPDLVVLAGGLASDRVERLRERGVPLLDTGNLTGWAACEDLVRILGERVGEPERAGELLRRCRIRRSALIADPAPSRRALYLGMAGDRIFGGAAGTSYHDVLLLAGLRDAADGTFTGWPPYAAEDLLVLKPELIVTDERSAEAVRGLSVMTILGCEVVALPAGLLDDAGLGILDAAEVLRDLLSRPR